MNFMVKVYSSCVAYHCYNSIVSQHDFVRTLGEEDALEYSCGIFLLFALKMVDRHSSSQQCDLIRRHIYSIEKGTIVYTQLEMDIVTSEQGALLLEESFLLSQVRDVINSEVMEKNVMEVFSSLLFKSKYIYRFYEVLVN